MNPVRIKQAKFLDGYLIELILSSGHSIVYDLKPKLNTARFDDLHSMELFQRGKLEDGKIIRWYPYAELTLDEILFAVTKRKPVEREEA